jgi:hypothetical protein
MANTTGKKWGGRTKGTPNKRSQMAIELAEKLKIDPLKNLLHFAAGDWAALGLKEFETRVTKDGQMIEIPVITADMRLLANRDAAKYIYPMLKPVEHVDEAQDEIGNQVTGIKIDLEERKRSIRAVK